MHPAEKTKGTTVSPVPPSGQGQTSESTTQEEGAPDESPPTPALPRNEADPKPLARRSAAQQIELDTLALADLAGQRLKAVVVLGRDGTKDKELVVRPDALRVKAGQRGGRGQRESERPVRTAAAPGPVGSTALTSANGSRAAPLTPLFVEEPPAAGVWGCAEAGMAC